MKIKEMRLIIFIVVITLSACNLNAVTFNSINEFEKWLSAQSDNTVDTPYAVKLNISSLNGGFQSTGSLGSVLNNNKDKYVNLDLSGSTFTLIDNAAFVNCLSLTSMKIPKGVTIIEKSAFLGCSNLNNIIIPDSVTIIDFEAFASCNSLTGIILPNSIKIIVTGTFRGCENLKNIIIPNNVTDIMMDAFSYCKSLTSITIPKSVNVIERYAFLDCNNLTSVTFLGTIPYSNNYYCEYPFDGDLREKFYATDKVNGTPGTYIREKYGTVWTRK